MKFHKNYDQIVISDKSLSTGTLLTPNTTDAAGEGFLPLKSLETLKINGFR